MCAHQLFYAEFNTEQLLFKAFSHIMRIFGSIELQTESTFPFLNTIILREIDQCTHGLFCMKFNYEQSLLEAFPHIMQ